MADETENKIRAQALADAKDGVSRKLIMHWDQLKSLVPNLPDQPPSEEALMGPTGKDAKVLADDQSISGQLIRDRKATFTGADGKDVTLDLVELEAKIAEAKKADKDDKLKKYNLPDDLNKLVPTEEALDEITAATKRGIDNASSTGNSIMIFIKAIFSWIGSNIGAMFGQGEGMSFSEAKAQAAAPYVADSVRKELNDLANDPSKASSALLNMQDSEGRTNIDKVVDGTISGTYTEMGATAPAGLVAAAPPLSEVKPVEFDIGIVRTEIAELVAGPNAEGKNLEERIYTQLKAGRDDALKDAGFMTRNGAPSDADLKITAETMSDVVSSTIAGMVSDPNYKTKDGKGLKELSKDEFKKHVADKVGEALLAQEKKDPKSIKLGGMLLYKVTLESEADPKTKETYLDLIKASVESEISSRDAEIRPLLNLFGKSESFAGLDKDALNRERQVAANIGIRGDGAEIGRRNSGVLSGQSPGTGTSIPGEIAIS